MLFSVIVPVYNVEKYLENCVNSILNQTYNDIEIILVDDGSPDNCPKMCDDLSNLDHRIRVIHKKNGGLSSARNAGLRGANGEYVLFVDSDDTIALDTCERFSRFISESKEVDVFIGLLVNDDGTYYSIKSDAIVGKVYAGNDYFNSFNESIIPCAVASVYRREFLLAENRFFVEGRYHEDNEFTPKVYLSAKRIVYTGIEFYIRYIRENSITQHKDKRKNVRDILFLGHMLIEFADTLDNNRSKNHVLDYVCMAYLSLFFEANIFQYDNIIKEEYIDKRFVINTAKSFRNRVKALLFCISPKIYLIVNKKVKHSVK